MKKLVLMVFCVTAVMISCKNSGQTTAGEDRDSLSADSLVAEMNDTTPMPMFLYYMSPDYMQIVYWTGLDEPDKAEYDRQDMTEYYEGNHQNWALQDGARRRAAGYTKLFVGSDKYVPVRYVGEVLKNPDGEDMYGGELHSRSCIPSPGLKYELVNVSDTLRDHHYGEMFVIAHDEYLKTRKPLKTEQLSTYDKVKPFASNVVQLLENQYGMKTERSQQSVRIGDRYVYGVVQFKPEGSRVIALEVVVDGDKVYSYPMEGNCEEGDMNSVWNVDDGGEYFSSAVCAAFEGPDGLEICFEHRAPESCTVGLFLLRDGKLLRDEYEVYHQMIDEQTPLWKKDLATMQKLYLENDPHENKGYKLTKYRWIDVDYDFNEEIWLRDADDKHGALFTVKNGDIQLVGVETDRLHMSFLRNKNGKGYVRISGSAGGPSMYTQVFEISNSRLVHTFTSLEVYGEIDECTFDGKPLSKEKGQEYISSLPPANEPYIYWMNVDD